MNNPLDPAPSERTTAIAEIERRLNANPSIASELDANGSGTRRAKILAVLNYVKARKYELAANKASASATLATARAHQAARATATKVATAPTKAPAPAVPSLLDKYHAMPSGSAKITFLRVHADALLRLQKAASKFTTTNK